MWVLHLGLLLSLLMVCSFAPGFYFVRKFRWSPGEKLIGAVGLSLILLYLATWGLYCLAPGGISRAACYAVSLGCLTLGILAHKDLAALFRVARIRRMTMGFGFLLVFTLVFLAMIRNYSGLGWSNDWLEHLQRTLFFLHRFPAATTIMGEYQLPARPPMMNVLTAFFLAQTADSFAWIQVVFTFLNLLLFLPCCLMLPALGAGRRTSILPLVFLFAANPVIFENATYVWTKSLTAFYVVFALWLYLAALRKKDSLRMTGAFLALAAGLLVHYSAGPYIFFLTAHYLFVVWKRPQPLRELATIAAACGLLLATWFGWSMATYGANTTFRSNTSITSAEKYSGSPVVKIARNMSDSIIPHVLRGDIGFNQRNRAGLIRDYAFSVYQVQLIFAMGLVGGPFVLWLLYRMARRRLPEWRFWRVLIPICVVVGLGVVGERDTFGTAHLTLIPLEALGLSLIAAAFPWRRAALIAVLAGCVVDFSLGVWLQARVQSFENAPGRTIFPSGVLTQDGGITPGVPTADSLSSYAWGNWFSKHRFHMNLELQGKLGWLKDNKAADQAAVAKASGGLQRELQEDVAVWGGWWARHDYRLLFLGDQAVVFADIWPPLAIALALALMAVLLWELRGRRPVSEPVSLAAAKTAASGKPAVRRSRR